MTGEKGHEDKMDGLRIGKIVLFGLKRECERDGQRRRVAHTHTHTHTHTHRGCVVCEWALSHTHESVMSHTRNSNVTHTRNSHVTHT